MNKPSQSPASKAALPTALFLSALALSGCDRTSTKTEEQQKTIAEFLPSELASVLRKTRNRLQGVAQPIEIGTETEQSQIKNDTNAEDAIEELANRMEAEFKIIRKMQTENICKVSEEPWSGKRVLCADLTTGTTRLVNFARSGEEQRIDFEGYNGVYLDRLEIKIEDIYKNSPEVGIKSFLATEYRSKRTPNGREDVTKKEINCQQGDKHTSIAENMVCTTHLVPHVMSQQEAQKALDEVRRIRSAGRNFREK